MSNQNKVIQTQFEKSVISIINYLIDNKKRMRLFEQNQELLNAIGFSHSNWGMYKNGYRHIPDKLHDVIRETLVEKYFANREYLRSGTGNMFSKILISQDDLTANYNKEIISQAEWAAKQKECDDLRARIEELKETIHLLKMHIETLQQRPEPAKNTSNPKQTSG